MAALALVLVILLASWVPGCTRALLGRLCGMGVPRLMIGFGPLVAARSLGGTRLELHAVPIGAFSQIVGLDPVDRPVAREAPDAFANRPALAKLLVLFAGAIGLVAWAVSISVAAKVLGGNAVVGGSVVIDSVQPDRPAARAGLQVEDEIVAVDGAPIHDTSDVAPRVNASTGAVRITVRRDGVERAVEVEPIVDAGTRRVGISLAHGVAYQRLPFGRAVAAGLLYPFRYASYVVKSLAKTWMEPQTPQTVVGPVGIVKVGHRQARHGARLFAGFVVAASTYIALLMLLPLPPYDGWRALAWLCRRRPRDVPPARALGVIPTPRPPPTGLEITALLLFGLCFALYLVPILVLVGLARRRPMAWSIAAVIAPSCGGVSVLAGLLLRSPFNLAYGIVCLILTALLYAPSVRDRFGLRCPACHHQAARAVLGAPDAMGCRACGSTFRRS
jgi:regulator of sigma E protease